MYEDDDAPTQTQTYTHLYPALGRHVITTSCTNDAGFVERSIHVDTQPDLQVSIDMSVEFTPAAVPLDVTFSVTQTAEYGFEEDIAMNCAFEFYDFESSTLPITLPSEGYTTTHTYTHDTSAGYVITSVVCSNRVSRNTFTFNVTLREAIVTSAFASAQLAFERGTPAYFHVDVTSGSHVTSVVDFGDGETLHLDPDLECGLDRASWLVEHVYTDIGNYTVTLRRLYNEIYEDDTSIQTQIVIQNSFVGLVFESTESLYIYNNTPVSQTFTLSEAVGQEPITDIHCEFASTDGIDSWSLFFASLPASFGVSSGVPLFARDSDTEVEIEATCGNLVTSSYVTQTSFALVLNDINVESLSSPNSPDWWRNRTQVLIVFSPLYSAADVTVSMGDGHDCVFDTSMATHSDAGCDVTLTTNANDLTVLLTYEYETWGVYEVTITASNGIAAYDVDGISLTVEVLEWTCFPPSIVFSDDLTTATLREIGKSDAAVLQPSSVSLDCMKSSSVTHQWSVLDSSLNDVTRDVTPALQTDRAELQLPVRMSLDYGTYSARLRVSMVIDESVFGVGEEVFGESDAMFQYVRTHMIAEQEQRGLPR